MGFHRTDCSKDAVGKMYGEATALFGVFHNVTLTKAESSSLQSASQSAGRGRAGSDGELFEALGVEVE